MNGPDCHTDTDAAHRFTRALPCFTVNGPKQLTSVYANAGAPDLTCTSGKSAGHSLLSLQLFRRQVMQV